MSPRYHVHETSCSCAFPPPLHVIYTVDPQPNSCQATIWVPFFHTVTVTVLAQITFALRSDHPLRIETNSCCGYMHLRIYGVTGRNKFLGGLLSILIFAHLSFGFYFMIRIGTSPSKFHNHFTSVRGLIRPLAQQLTGINLDAFKICNYKRWRLGELLFTNLMIAFGMSPASNMISPRDF